MVWVRDLLGCDIAALDARRFEAQWMEVRVSLLWVSLIASFIRFLTQIDWLMVEETSIVKKT